jgi:hypothetical protein
MDWMAVRTAEIHPAKNRTQQRLAARIRKPVMGCTVAPEETGVLKLPGFTGKNEVPPGAG